MGGVEQIAVIGMACRVPGARNTREYWNNLCAGQESVTFFSREELLRAGLEARRVDHPSFVKASPMLAGVELFDADLFECSPREARLMDPQHRVFLETAWEALEDAGYAPRAYGGAIGIFAGAGGAISSYLLANAHRWQGRLGATGGFHHLGNDKDFLATRASFKLDLRGPGITVQTACSTSLVAIHMACQSLLAGECDMALAGGVTIRVPQVGGYFYEEGGIFSPDGHCRAFDAKAMGTIFGSGVGLVLLKPLAAALDDGDLIHAVILASAINNDGASKVSYTASTREGQARAMREAFALAEVEPASLGFVEAHGTGTLLGDPLEVAAMTQVFRGSTEQRQFCALGSVKSNIGHLEAAAGVASFIKTVLALRQGQVPPSLHFEQPNPRIDFAASPFFVPTSLTPWPHTAAGEPRRAAVNSLGIGGTNAFALLEAAPERPKAAADDRPYHLLTLSARTPAALGEQVERWTAFLGAAPELPLADVAATAAGGRALFDHRAYVVARDIAGAAAQLASWASDATPAAAARPVAFLFSGQAAQYVGMGRQLFATQPVFRGVLERCHAWLMERYQLSLLDTLFPANDLDSPLDQTAYAQPALFALQMALVELWRSFGVVPAAVIGHSIGEVAAVVTAGALSLEDGLALVAERGHLMQSLPPGGAMTAVLTELERVAPLVAAHADRVAVATLNGPRNTVISGEAEAVRTIADELAAAGVRVRPLRVSHAFHSPLMDPILEDFRQVCARLSVAPPQLLMVSALTSQPADQATLGDPEYWVRHLRQPVRFADAFLELSRSGFTAFVEIGPSATLLGMAGELLPDARAALLLPSLRKRREDWDQLLETAGELFVHGCSVDRAAIESLAGRQRVALPTYPFARQRFWEESPASPATATDFAFAGSPAAVWPGRRFKSPAFAGDIFESRSSVADLPTFEDHRLHGVVVVPGAAHLSLLLSTAEAALGSVGCALENMSFPQALILPEDGARSVQVILRPDEGSGRPLEIVSSDRAPAADATWTRHADGILRRLPADSGGQPLPTGDALAAIRDRCTEELAGADFYAGFWQAGYHLGPTFRWVRQAWRRDGEVFCRMERPENLEPDEPFVLHPGLIDACFQISCAAFPGGGLKTVLASGDIYVPLSVTAWRYLAPLQSAALFCHVRVQAELSTHDLVVADIDLWDERGHQVAAVSGLRMKRAPRAVLLKSLAAESKTGLYQLEWQVQGPVAEQRAAQSTSGTSRTSRYLIFADRQGWGQQLAVRLQQSGARAVLAEPGARQPGQAGQEWVERAPGVFTFDPTQSEHYAQLLAQLADADHPLTVVSLLALDLTDASAATDLYAVCGTTLHLLQALTSWRGSSQTALWLVTAGAQQVQATDPAPVAAQGALIGLGRVIAQEHADLWGGLVDLDPAQLDSSLAALEALLQPDAEHELQLALRADAAAPGALRTMVPRLVRAPHPLTPPTWTPSPTGTYLITGGRGGLGLTVARWLVERGARHLALVGRSAPSAAVQAEVAELRAAGAHLQLPQADVADRAQMAQVIAEIAAGPAPLCGVIHAAGLIEDGILLHQTWSRFAEVMAPKVAGALNLHTLTADPRVTGGQPLDCFILFSSVASLLGAPGQGNYAAGNAFLDALAQARRAQGLPAISLNWGPWSEVGMAAQVAARGVRHWMAGGLGAIAPDEGLAALESALGQGLVQVGVLPFDWRAMLAQYGDQVPSLLAEIAREVTPKSAGDSPRTSPKGDVLTRLEALPAVRRAGFVRDWVHEQVAAVLGLDEDRPLEADRGFAAMGLDSLMALELRNRLQSGLSSAHQLPATLVFDFPTVATLATFISRDVLRLEASPAGQVEQAQSSAAELLAEVGQLSDAEAEAMLLAELAELERERENP